MPNKISATSVSLTARGVPSTEFDHAHPLNNLSPQTAPSQGRHASPLRSIRDSDGRIAFEIDRIDRNSKLCGHITIDEIQRLEERGVSKGEIQARKEVISQSRGRLEGGMWAVAGGCFAGGFTGGTLFGFFQARKAYSMEISELKRLNKEILDALSRYEAEVNASDLPEPVKVNFCSKTNELRGMIYTANSTIDSKKEETKKESVQRFRQIMEGIFHAANNLRRTSADSSSQQITQEGESSSQSKPASPGSTQ